MDFLTAEAGIRAIVQYHPLYRYPLFQKLGAGDQDCPVLEKWWDNSFSLPWWIGMPAVVSLIIGARRLPQLEAAIQALE
ncbi:MAG: hypothetical protein JXA78_02120 [Anaerolineales bacterium]|nr:hypothetical protein [Anaerolineales bacterium]